MSWGVPGPTCTKLVSQMEIGKKYRKIQPEQHRRISQESKEHKHGELTQRADRAKSRHVHNECENNLWIRKISRLAKDNKDATTFHDTYERPKKINAQSLKNLVTPCEIDSIWKLLGISPKPVDLVPKAPRFCTLGHSEHKMLRSCGWIPKYLVPGHLKTKDCE